MHRRSFIGSLLALAAALAHAQGRYPDRPVRLVVPFAPGGDGDIMGRLWAKYAAPLFGATIVVDNKAGAGGAIGAAEVARARADGYTLLLGTTTTQIINPAASPNPAYDALKDFVLVGMVSVNPTCIIVNPGVPAGSLKELVEPHQGKPRKVFLRLRGAGHDHQPDRGAFQAAGRRSRRCSMCRTRAEARRCRISSPGTSR